MGFPYSPEIQILGVGDCCKYLSSLPLAHDEGGSHLIIDLKN